MRRLVITGAALAAVALPAGTLLASAPPDTTPTPTDGGVETTTVTVPVAVDSVPATSVSTGSSATGDTTSGATSMAPIPVFDDSGNQVATITVTDVQTEWTDYPEGDAPDSGHEYVRVTVNVESQIPDGTFNVNVDDFILQDNNGFVTGAESIKTADQDAADEDVTTEADLANGEGIELALAFEVVSSVGPQSVFYRPDDDRLVDVIDVA